MAPVKRTTKGRATGDAAAGTPSGSSTNDMQHTSGHATTEGRVGKRRVKHKAKDLATQGTTPWDSQSRQILLDSRAVDKNWRDVCRILGRTNQSVRSEFNKMNSGARNVAGGVDWQQKALVCNQQRTRNYPRKGAGSSRTTTTAGNSTTSANNTTMTATLVGSTTPTNSTATTPDSGALSAISTVPVDSPTMPTGEHVVGTSSDTVSPGHSNPTTTGDRTELDVSESATTSGMARVSYVRGDYQSARKLMPVRQRMTMALQQHAVDEDEDDQDDIAYKQRYTCFVAPPKKRQLRPTDFHPTDHWVYGRTIEEEPERKTKPSKHLFRKEGWHYDQDGTLWYDHPYGFSRPCLTEGVHVREENVSLSPLSSADIDADLRLFQDASG